MEAAQGADDRGTRGSAADAKAEPRWPADALEIGRILDAWGVKGWVRVQPFSADPQALLASRRWFVKPPEVPFPAVPAAAGRYPESLSIIQIRPHGDGFVALAAGYADRGAAESLRGARLFVGRSSFPAAGTDEYYWVDLIGLEVRNRQGDRLGDVAGLIDTGPHSVLRVRPEGSAAADEEAERLIPFVAAYVDAVSLEQRLITVDWGLDF